jgi:hypothetical protein
MEGLWNYINYDSSGVYMYGVLAGSILGVSLLVCGVVSDLVMAGGGGGGDRSAWGSVWALENGR